MFFRDIIGQDVLKKRLLQTVAENRVSHAWLFFGPEGTGALPLAIAFAGYILCTSRTPDDACGTCSGCNKSGKYIHPDLHFVFPVNKTREVDEDIVTSDDFMTYWRDFLSGNSYGRVTQWFDFIELENKQGIINTEESKRLLSKLSLKSFESDYKVVIIWQPEKMNDQAGNKLLKLLEEPPPLTIFILVSENPEQLLATVRSRCMPVKVPRITDNEMISGLMDRYQVSQERATEVARFADGNYLKALEFMKADDDAGYNFNQFRDLMRSCLKTNIPELIKHADALSGLNRERQKAFLEYGLGIIRESLVLHFENNELVRIPDNEMEFTPKFAPFINGSNVVLVESELNKAIRDIERNGNGKIIFMDLALKLSDLINR